MKTVLMAIAIIKDDNKILLRKFDPDRNPYKEPWGLFGGKLDGDGPVEDVMNIELKARWNMEVSITERLWWGEDIKEDNDGETKRFLYIDALCSIKSGEPATNSNPREEVAWAAMDDLSKYRFNPPTELVLTKLGYLK